MNDTAKRIVEMRDQGLTASDIISTFKEEGIKKPKGGSYKPTDIYTVISRSRTKTKGRATKTATKTYSSFPALSAFRELDKSNNVDPIEKAFKLVVIGVLQGDERILALISDLYNLMNNINRLSKPE